MTEDTAKQTVDFSKFAILCSDLSRGIMAVVAQDDDNYNADIKEIGKCLVRALSINKLLGAYGQDELTVVTCVCTSMPRWGHLVTGAMTPPSVKLCEASTTVHSR